MTMEVLTDIYVCRYTSLLTDAYVPYYNFLYIISLTLTP